MRQGSRKSRRRRRKILQDAVRRGSEILRSLGVCGFTDLGNHLDDGLGMRDGTAGVGVVGGLQAAYHPKSRQVEV